MSTDTTDTQRILQLIKTQQETIDYLVQYVERLEAQIRDRIDEVESNGSPAVAAAGGKTKGIRWDTLSGEARQAAWLELDRFVTELVDRYGMHQHVRPCWWRHGAAVEELTALYGAWYTAYAPGAEYSMLTWWEDVRDRVQKRLRLIFNKCRDGHAELELSEWRSPRDHEEFLTMVEKDSVEPEKPTLPTRSK